jgi:hypothetical protein
MSRHHGAAASWDAVPATVIALVLTHLAGDARSLCAAACVARAWRAAAAEPRLWARLAGVRRLTDARLAALVARARGHLEHLDVDDALQLTDAGLMVRCNSLIRSPRSAPATAALRSPRWASRARWRRSAAACAS